MWYHDDRAVAVNSESVMADLPKLSEMISRIRNEVCISNSASGKFVGGGSRRHYKHRSPVSTGAPIIKLHVIVV